MGFDDRNSRKESNGTSVEEERVVNLNEIIAIIAKLAVLLLLLFLTQRVPVIWIKIAAPIVILLFGWRWLSQSFKTTQPQTAFDRGKLAEARQDYDSAIRHYEEALGGNIKPNQVAVRLLVCYDAAGEVGRTKTMIQQIEGREFPDSVAEELEDLASNYFPVVMEKTANGVRLKLI